MDVALLSSPTNAPGNCSIQLYRLSGGSNAPVAPSVTSESTHSSSKVWETTRDDKAVLVEGQAANRRAGPKSADALKAVTPPTYIQPRLPETLQWKPDGASCFIAPPPEDSDQLYTLGTSFAFASSAASLMLYSVHDGKPILKHSPLAFDEQTPVYLLNWEQTLSPGHSIPREDITADSLGKRLPLLSAVKKVHEKQ